MTINPKRTFAAALLMMIGLLGTEATALLECAHAAQPEALANQRQPAGAPIAGIVVDPNGNPLGNADVWLVVRSLDDKPDTLDKTKTDAAGRFRLSIPGWWFQLVTFRQELGLVAAREGFRLGGASYSRTSIPPQAGIRLQLGAPTPSTITVLGPDKKSLSKATVEVQDLLVDRFESGMSEDHARDLFESNDRKFVSTPNGYLWGKGRIAFEPGGECRAEVEADGILQAKTEWLQVDNAKSDVFPNLVIQRVHALTGVVRDRQGKPVASAKILRTDDGPLRLQADSDAQGQFRLANVSDGRGFLFVEAAGFRYHGQIVPAGSKDVQVVLTRTTESVTRPLTTLPATLSREERLKLARRILEPAVQNVLEKGEDYDRFRTLETLAKVDPPRLLELLEKKRFKEPHFADSLRGRAAESLASTSLDEAVTVVETITDPFQRALICTKLADSLPDARRGRQIELLGEALVHIRNHKEAAQRVVMLAIVADQLLKRNEKERAAKVIEEGRKIAENLPTAAWAGYARAVYAESLALFDLPAALELTRGLSDAGEFDRHHGNIAHKVAGLNPAEAERVLGMLKDQSRTYRSLFPPRVCYRMAPVDLPRARRIADAIDDPYQRAHAYGVMAQALSKTKPAEATKLLQESFAKLTAHAQKDEDRFNGMHDASSLAASLLPVAESIDPQLVPEFLWRAVAMRHLPPEKHERHPNAFEAMIAPAGDATLAMMLARYDRELAASFRKANAKQAAALARSSYGVSVLATPMLIDPRSAVEFLESLPDGQDRDTSRRILAALLVLDGDALWSELTRKSGIWVIDTEDLF